MLSVVRIDRRKFGFSLEETSAAVHIFHKLHCLIYSSS